MTPVYDNRNVVVINQTWTPIGGICNDYQYAWQTDYNATIDPYSMGNTWGAPRRSLSGGRYDGTTNCGSRSMYCNLRLYNTANTARGCNQKRKSPQHVLSWGKKLSIVS